MWADNETSEDLLGFKVHADLLIDVIRDDNVLPVTIGVFGDWGSGKSSILKIVNSELSGEKDALKDDTLVLYFNGWTFEGYDDAKAALLESIIEKFDQHKTIGNKVKDKTKDLLQSIKWMRFLSLGLKKIALPIAAAYFTGGVSLIPFLLQEFSNLSPTDLATKLTGDDAEEFLKGIIEKHQKEDITLLVRKFRKDFEEMIDKSEIKKLVVIIDDLDRCQPERLIENLEAIKLFLNVEKTAFLIGADPRIVRHAIEFRYKTDGIENADDPNSRNERIVSDYLEKLIQIPYNLPKLSDNEVETYITLLYCKKELADNFPKVLTAFQKYREENRYGAFGFGEIKEIGLPAAELSKLEGSISLIASLSPIITEGLNGNPRQIKRFLNTFTLRNRLVKVAKLPNFHTAVLAKLMVLEYSEQALFRKLYEWQIAQKGEAKELVALEKLASENNKEGFKKDFAEWSSEEIIRWLNVEPKLSTIDLRDYYWISRDQLEGSISGSSLIPILIRSLAIKLVGHGSGTILTNTVSTEVSKLSELETGHLFVLLGKDLAKNPENDKIHRVFIELMAQNVFNSVTAYSKIIPRVDNSKIPFSLRNDLQLAAKRNTGIESVYALFNPDSQIGKALNQKK